MSTTITELSATIDEMAIAARELAEREAELGRREAELASGMEAWTVARQESTVWAEATAARDRHWRQLIAMKLGHLEPNSKEARVLRLLEGMAAGSLQMGG